jgi:hypothetical protein
MTLYDLEIEIEELDDGGDYRFSPRGIQECLASRSTFYAPRITLPV